MNRQDLVAIREYGRRTGALIDALRRLSALALATVSSVDADVVSLEIRGLEGELARFIDEVAAREAASWSLRGRLKPRHEPPPRIPLSTEVEPHAVVERFGVDGRPKGATRQDPPKPSGKWTKWRAEEGR